VGPFFLFRPLKKKKRDTAPSTINNKPSIHLNHIYIPFNPPHTKPHSNIFLYSLYLLLRCHSSKIQLYPKSFIMMQDFFFFSIQMLVSTAYLYFFFLCTNSSCLYLSAPAFFSLIVLLLRKTVFLNLSLTQYQYAKSHYKLIFFSFLPA
jgi:hypothetical protein